MFSLKAHQTAKLEDMGCNPSFISVYFYYLPAQDCLLTWKMKAYGKWLLSLWVLEC